MIKIGHRGAAGLEPENTLRSFEKAAELGADMVELDVRLCKSGEIVVIHDSTINRTTSGRGKVADMTLDEIKRYNAGAGETIPTLEEVLTRLAGKVKIDIELKGPECAGPVSTLLRKFINAGLWRAEDFLVSSFSRQQLVQFHKLLPEIKLGLLLFLWPFGYGKFAKKNNLYAICPNINFLTAGAVKTAHQRGLKVIVWTLNHKKDIDRAKAWGVDGICSDFPNRI